MSVDEFWNKDPDLFWAYRFSYYNKIKNEQESKRIMIWQQANLNSIAVSVALANAFGKKKIDFPSYEETFKKADSEGQTQNEQEILVAKIKDRVSQIQKMFKEK